MVPVYLREPQSHSISPLLMVRMPRTATRSSEASHRVAAARSAFWLETSTGELCKKKKRQRCVRSVLGEARRSCVFLREDEVAMLTRSASL